MDLVCLGGLWGWDLEDVTSDLAALESTGRWAVVLPYAGTPICARLRSWAARPPRAPGGYRGPKPGAWRSSLDAQEYQQGVAAIRRAIAAGTVYQANLCRVLRAPLPDPDNADLHGLFQLLGAGNPSPYGGLVRLPGVGVVSASPELFLERRGRGLRSGPIKGTGATESDLQDKDRAENVMIVDLVRNDLARVAVPGTVEVPTLMEVQRHPGLVHLVSYVDAQIDENMRWSAIIDAAFPPGSVTGAPKSTALEIIDQLEPVDRGVYCGAVGWVDADAQTGCLAVAIRTFWQEGSELCFGTGAGITWASDPLAEWQETELKAARLIALAGQSLEGNTHDANDQ